MKEFHWFVSHGMGWKCGATLQEAMEGAFCTSYFGDMKSWLRTIHRDGTGAGIPAFACRVLAPMDADYDIDYFVPVGVDRDECQNLLVTYVTQKHVTWIADPHDRIRQLERELADKKTYLSERYGASA